MYSAHWNLVTKDVFATGCWDHACKVWDPNRTASVRTYCEHAKEVYEVQWSPVRAEIFASVSGDGCLKV